MRKIFFFFFFVKTKSISLTALVCYIIYLHYLLSTWSLVIMKCLSCYVAVSKNLGAKSCIVFPHRPPWSPSRAALPASDFMVISHQLC